jgi:hypothetical protein
LPRRPALAERGRIADAVPQMEEPGTHETRPRPSRSEEDERIFSQCDPVTGEPLFVIQYRNALKQNGASKSPPSPSRERDSILSQIDPRTGEPLFLIRFYEAFKKYGGSKSPLSPPAGADGKRQPGQHDHGDA